MSDAEVRDGDDVLVSNGGSCQRLLTKTHDETGIVANQIRQNNFDGVCCFEKDVARLKDYTHTTLPQTPH